MSVKEGTGAIGIPGRTRPANNLWRLIGILLAMALLVLSLSPAFDPGRLEYWGLSGAIILAAALAAWGSLNRLTPLFVLAGGVLAPSAFALAATLGDRARAATLIAAVIAGCALVAWAAYKESPRTTALGAVATGVARALLFGSSLLLLPLAFFLVFGNLLHILPEVKDDPSSDDTWQATIAMALIMVIRVGVPAGAILGLLGWAFGRPSPPGARPPDATGRGSPTPYVDTGEKALDG